MSWPVPYELETAWRQGGYTVRTVVDVYRETERLDLDLDVVSGGVTMRDEPGVRATFDVDVAPEPGLWDEFAAGGITLRPWLEFTWGIDRHVVPLGWYDVEEQSLSYSPGGLLSLSGCPDRWARLGYRRFDRPETPNGNAVDLAVFYAVNGLGYDLTGQDVQRSPVRVAGQVYEDSREEAVQALLTAAGRRGYVSRDGRLVVRKPPTLSGPPVWEVDSFRQGVLVSAERTRSNRAVRNRIIVVPAGGATFRRFRVDDYDQASPTRVNGPLGVRPRFLASPAIRTLEQAQVAARDLLRRSTGTAADLSITAAPHWGLEPDDVIGVALPGIGGDGWAPETHQIASVTLPLPQRGQPVTQQITTRSTRPDGGEDIDEEVAA